MDQITKLLSQSKLETTQVYAESTTELVGELSTGIVGMRIADKDPAIAIVTMTMTIHRATEWVILHFPLAIKSSDFDACIIGPSAIITSQANQAKFTH